MKLPTIQIVNNKANNPEYPTFLVRNVGKRAVLVRLQHSSGEYTPEQLTRIAVVCAIQASKLGYKKIMVRLFNDTVRIVNWSLYHSFQFAQIHRNSISVGLAKSVLKQDVQFTRLTSTKEPLEFCNYYHCPGDCGQSHNEKEYFQYSKNQTERECILCEDGIMHDKCGSKLHVIN